MNRSVTARAAFGVKQGLSRAHAATLARLSSPEKIQDFISTIRQNNDKGADTLKSVVRTLNIRNAHCIEGSFVAAAALWLGGEPPLLMDLRAKGDDDHIVTLFRAHGCWGAISKSNHVWLRWRDPVYRSLRELAMSYFHEYTNDAGQKTLRAYSRAFDLRRLRNDQWLVGNDDCWEAGAALDDARHYPLISGAQARSLKLRDALERRADALREH